MPLTSQLVFLLVFKLVVSKTAAGSKQQLPLSPGRDPGNQKRLRGR